MGREEEAQGSEHRAQVEERSDEIPTSRRMRDRRERRVRMKFYRSRAGVRALFCIRKGVRRQATGDRQKLTKLDFQTPDARRPTPPEGVRRQA